MVVHAQQMRDSNRRRILQIVRLRAPIARADIARQSGLTAPAVSSIVADLMAEGLVRQVGRVSGRVGQPSIALAVNPDGAYTIGLHLDHDSITGTVIDLLGRTVAVAEMPVDLPTPDTALAALKAMVERLVAQAAVPRARLLGVGLATMGPIDVAAGAVLRPAFMPGWDTVPLRDQLEAATGLPVHLENNATAAAGAEHWFGRARTYRDFLYVYFGFGLGAGVFLDGRLHRGADGNAGELGHMIVEPDGLECGCGGRGCLETVASMSALRRDLGPHKADPAQLAADVAANDAEVMAWIDAMARRLVVATVNAANLLDVPRVVFGGRPPEPVMRAIVARVAWHGRRYRRRKGGRLKIELGLTGAQVAALGAATLPLFDAFATDLPAAGLRDTSLRDKEVPKEAA